MAESFKFLHASDFHLDEPIQGLAEIPSHLKQILANAPYDSATRLFDLAIAERVDFVLLSGDLFNMELAGPRSSAFLLSQFERLTEKNIDVYWCAGAVDQPDRWPSSIELPENVLTFSSAYVEQVAHRKNGRVVATIHCSGHDEKRRSGADFYADVNDPFPIAFTHGEFDPPTMIDQNIRYWALGGRHKANKIEKSGSVIGYPGTPQGRSPKESGARGCNICRVDSTGKLKVQSVELDSVRWKPQKVAINERSTLKELKDVLGERAMKIAADTNDVTILINWFLTTSGEFHPALRRPELADELLEWVRDEFGRSDRGLWSVRLTIEPPEALPIGWYEEDTILGEYLRAIGRYQSDDSLKLNLHDYLPSTVEGDALAGIGHVTNANREEILRAAALVGVDYLADGRDPLETNTTQTI